MGLKLLHLHLHGLIRSHDLELGRDPDTGGQTLYVLELVKNLALCKSVEKVDLVTRLIKDRKCSLDYAQSREQIVSGAQIIRIPFGPNRYLRKELLWPYLDNLADYLTDYLQKLNSLPDWIHAHYADAGYVGSIVSSRLGLPFVFTGHSLGREKKRRLIESGLDYQQIENTYSITRRIQAEELSLNKANLVVTSTTQEANYQYSRYRNFVSKQAKIIPPGVDLTRFNYSSNIKVSPDISNLFKPFLKDLSLPPLLSISRAVRRKNLPALVEAYGSSDVLRKKYNLILMLGIRKDVRFLDKQQRDVFQQIFELVDKYNLYGHIAYPKFHRRDQIPGVYKWAAERKGFFVNPALTEPFGLTLLEAAACGLPLVATNDGGPKEILAKCRNGVLCDAMDIENLQKTLESLSLDPRLWDQWSKNGLDGITKNYSWQSHVSKYLSLMSSNFGVLNSQSLAQVIPISGIKAS